jgi:hypothetical protein
MQIISSLVKSDFSKFETSFETSLFDYFEKREFTPFHKIIIQFELLYNYAFPML